MGQSNVVDVMLYLLLVPPIFLDYSTGFDNVSLLHTLKTVSEQVAFHLDVGSEAVEQARAHAHCIHTLHVVVSPTQLAPSIPQESANASALPRSVSPAGYAQHKRQHHSELLLL